jgi:hypothetical protein
MLVAAARGVIADPAGPIGQLGTLARQSRLGWLSPSQAQADGWTCRALVALAESVAEQPKISGRVALLRALGDVASAVTEILARTDPTNHGRP